ncbi:hypothetical protein LIZ33_09660 [Desulfovibrio desulfuricans]|nr:hypothetical protein [Desulfovibrio desulfuricans]MCB7346508.1 hypothetical protein [Desulfovibrio desulfuricans]
MPACKRASPRSSWAAALCGRLTAAFSRAARESAEVSQPSGERRKVSRAVMAAAKVSARASAFCCAFCCAASLAMSSGVGMGGCWVNCPGGVTLAIYHVPPEPGDTSPEPPAPGRASAAASS